MSSAGITVDYEIEAGNPVEVYSGSGNSVNGEFRVAFADGLVDLTSESYSIKNGDKVVKSFGNAKEKDLTYYGTVFATEYNPQVWDLEPSWYNVDGYTAGQTLVFNGWVYKTSSGGYTDRMAPGDIVQYKFGTDAGWYAGDVRLASVDETIDIYATWALVNQVRTNNSAFNGGSPYTNIRLVNSEVTSFNSDYFTNCTIRANPNTSVSNAILSFGSGSATVGSGGCFIDNITLRGSDELYRHGDNSRGLFAGGNLLVIGTGIYSRSTSASNNVSGMNGYLQISGGSNGGTIDHTKLIIHSGIFSNISNRSTVTHDTVTIAKGGILIDTLVGGSNSSVGGNAYVYLTGLTSMANYFNETQLQRAIKDSAGNYIRTEESSIIEGGGNSYSTVSGSTYLYLSGTTDVWDVQAGGRSSTTKINGDTHLEISGKAIVRHIACGAITDGNDSNDKTCIDGDLNVTVRDQAKVATLVGAGFDTWSSSTYMSYYGGKITVNIYGGETGFVYGGGYRGAIGNTTNKVEIEINILGGTVKNDVYGGGRGGLDKVQMSTGNTPAPIFNNSRTGPAFYDTTGKSQVIGNIAINMYGGTVEGSIYGGGQSVAAIKQYGNTTSWNNKALNTGTRLNSDVAKVTGNVTLNLIGGTVNNDVYGAGRGVELDGTTVTYDYAAIPSIVNGEFTYITWLGPNTIQYDTSNDALAKYATYAAVAGNISVNLRGTNINGNVYGGGALGVLTGNISITATGGTINQDVYGAGKGLDNSTAVGKVTGNSTVNIDGATVRNDVYGGGAYGVLTGSAQVDVNSAVNGNVYGAGKGSSSTVGTGQVGSVTHVTIGSSGVVGVLDNVGAVTRESNVYGGGAYGKIQNGDSAVTVNGLVTKDVFGGGLGLSSYSLNYGYVPGNASVTVNNSAAVKGNVYGGGAYGIVNGSTVVAVYGIVEESVFGAGQGSPSSVGTGRVGSVGGVTIGAGSEVWESVYGGGAYGNVNSGNITVTVDGEVGISVYGGGLGKTEYSTDYGYVPGNTTVITGSDSEIGVNVYGGGENGVVNGNTSVTVRGIVQGSVFGGGFGFVGQKSTGTTTVTIDGGTIGSEDDSGPEAHHGSVYGGAYNGRIDGSTSVSLINDATVYGNVFGSGLGVLGNESSTGASTVTVTSGTVYGNVYGAAMNGYVSSNATVTVNGGTVQGAVYGAGKGNRKDAILEAYPSVNGNVTVQIQSGSVNEVYGGSALGLVTGASSVNITGGTISGDVYGAGFGTLGIVSNSSDSTVTITGGTFGFSNIYGGAKNGIVSGDTSVESSTVALGGSVFGGGLGALGYESVTGTASVIFNSGTVNGNIYGAAKDGWVGASSVIFKSGTVNGDVYGAGVGNTYTQNGTILAYPSVIGNVSLEIQSGTVNGDVYGGSAFGLVKGDIDTCMTGGTITGALFGGGKGTTDCVSVNGVRKVMLSGTAEIRGNLYGGSANGDDRAESGGLFVYDSHSKIYIQAGTIGGSVFGGGFKGHTAGNTYIYLGAHSLIRANTSDFTKDTIHTEKSLIIGESIYLGGDVGVITDASQAYTENMVLGTGTMYIAEALAGDSYIQYLGSIMGAGNSCKTQGNTNVYVYRVNLQSNAEAFHRITNLVIEECTIALNGRATVDHSADIITDSDYSLFRIDNLILRGGTNLTLNGPVELIQTYVSQNTNGDPTTSTSPFNKVILGEGKILIIRYLDEGDVEYGTVSGYTILSTRGDDTYFGAYALGSTSSVGGFVVFNDGSYVPADRSDLDEECRCWYIAGTINNEISLTIGSDLDESATVPMPSMQSGSSYRYTGGTYISTSATGEYELIDNLNYDENQFYIKFGYGSEDGYILFPDENGTFLIDDYSEVDPVMGKIGGQVIGHTRNPCMNLCVEGNFTQSLYLGYALIYINEVRPIELPDHTHAYVVVNSIHITINLYTSFGEDTGVIEEQITIGAVAGSGSTTILLPAGHAGQTVVVDSVSADANNETNNVVRFYLTAVKNNNNTLGWTDHLGEFSFLTNGTSPSETLGTLQGGYFASLTIAVKAFTGTETVEKYYINLKIMDGDTETLSIDITVLVEKIPDVYVKFVMMDAETAADSTTLTYKYPYGSRITVSDCPPTEANFVGWYTDEGCNNPFSYSTPLTKKNLTLYALYMYDVTLDYMDGTTSVIHVPRNNGVIGDLDVDLREGYTFEGWYTETDFIYQWDTATTIVEGDMTLYAKWVGWTVMVDFVYYDGENYVPLPLGYDIYDSDSFAKISFGGKFDNQGTFLVSGAPTTISTLEYAQYKLEAAGVHLVFIYWMYLTDYQEMILDPVAYGLNGNKDGAVYEDTFLRDVKKLQTDIIEGNIIYHQDPAGVYHVQLCAYLSKMAAKVVMDPASEDEHGDLTPILDASIEPPESFLIFPYNDTAEQESHLYKMTIDMNGATRPGYALNGWYIKHSASNPTISGTDKYEFTAGTKIYLTVKLNTEYPSQAAYPYVMEYSVGQAVVQVIGITNEDMARLTGTGAMFEILFIPTWEFIEYTITIGNPANGTIYALVNTENGPVRFTSMTMHYNDQFEITFIPNDGYQFHHWACTGEGQFNDAYTESTGFVVYGDTNISAYVVGPQIIKIFIQYDGLDEDAIPDLVLSENGTDVDFTFTKAIFDTEKDIIQYIGTANLGDHSLYLLGPTTGELYELELSVESTTASNIYYITAEKTLYGRRAVVAETTFTEGGITYGVVDEVNNRVAAISVDAGMQDIVIPASVLHNAEAFLVTMVSSDLLDNCTAPKSVTYLGTTIYMNGTISVVTNGIEVDGSTDIAGPGNGIADITEYIFQYGTHPTEDIEITLEPGYYVYLNDDDTPKYDVNGDPVESGTSSASFTIYDGVPTGTYLVLDGKIAKLPYTVTLQYVCGTDPLEGSGSFTIEYGEAYMDELSQVVIPASLSDYELVMWTLPNGDIIDEQTLCTGEDRHITITGHMVEDSNTKVTVIIKIQTDSGYDSDDSTEISVNGGIAYYRYEIVDKHAAPAVSLSGPGSHSVSGTLITLTGVTDATEMTLTYDWKTITISVTDANGTTALSYHADQVITLAVPSDTNSIHYNGWIKTGLSGNISDNSYVVTVTDVEGDHAPYSIAPNEETRYYEVSLITMRGTIYEGEEDKGRTVILQMEYDTAVSTAGTNITVGTRTFRIDDTGVEHYNTPSWSITAATDGKVRGDITLPVVWNILSYTLTLDLGEHVSVSASSGLDNIDFTPVEGKQLSGAIGYNSIIRVSIHFDSFYTLSETSKYYIDGVETSSLVPVKQSTMQEYVLQFFISGNTELKINAKWAGNNLYFMVDNGSGYVLQETIQVSAHSTEFISISDYELKYRQAGYLFDGWYLNTGCSSAPVVVKKTDGLSEAWFYSISVGGSHVYLYARNLAVTATNTENLYDGLEHTVNVGTSSAMTVGPTITYADEHGTPVAGPISVTYYDDDTNGRTYSYHVSFIKTYSDGNESWTGAEQTLEGDFGVSLIKRKLVVIASSLIVSDASEIGDRYERCTVIGIAYNAQTATQIDTATPTEYILTGYGGCTVEGTPGAYVISGTGYINSHIAGVTIVDGGQADRSVNYIVTLYDGQIVVWGIGSTVTVQK